MIRGLAVVVPARNERALIGRCLSALTAARAQALARTTVPAVSILLIVVADACTDETAALTRSVDGVEVIEITAGSVGSARAAGALRALDEFCSGPQGLDAANVWIANTDADSVVPVNWLSEQLALADSGVDVMLGTVRPDPADLSPESARLWQEHRAIAEPRGRIYGANLGIRADHYLRAGGFAPLTEHEDVDLVTRARLAGSQTHATDVCEVLTSGRRHGRTPGGFARYLRVDLPGTTPAPLTT